jgi:hypothetical protein
MIRKTGIFCLWVILVWLVAKFESLWLTDGKMLAIFLLTESAWIYAAILTALCTFSSKWLFNKTRKMSLFVNKLARNIFCGVVVCMAVIIFPFTSLEDMYLTMGGFLLLVGILYFLLNMIVAQSEYQTPKT